MCFLTQSVAMNWPPYSIEQRTTVSTVIASRNSSIPLQEKPCSIRSQKMITCRFCKKQHYTLTGTHNKREKKCLKNQEWLKKDQEKVQSIATKTILKSRLIKLQVLRPTKYLDKIIAIIYVSTEKSLTTNHHMTFEFLLSYYIGIRTLKDLVHEIIYILLELIFYMQWRNFQFLLYKT